MAIRQHGKGLWRHSFLPTTRGPILALYESEQPRTASYVEAQLDAPDGPNGDWGAFDTHAYPVAPTCELGSFTPAILPASAFPTMPFGDYDAASSGSIFWVTFTRHPGTPEPATTWKKHGGEPGRLASPYPSKLHNHCFLPTSAAEGEPGPIVGIWETREPMDVDDFAGFLNGPASPLDPSAYAHVAHCSAVPGGGTALALPSSVPAFPRRAATRMGFMGSLWMPMMDDTMIGASELPRTVLSFCPDVDDGGLVSAGDGEVSYVDATPTDAATGFDDDGAFQDVFDALPLSSKTLYSRLQHERSMKVSAEVRNGPDAAKDAGDGHLGI